MRAFAQFRYIVSNIQLPNNNAKLWAENKALQIQRNSPNNVWILRIMEYLCMDNLTE